MAKTAKSTQSPKGSEGAKTPKAAKGAADVASVCVFVTPKSSADAVDGIAVTEDLREVKVRVRAVPDEGKANKAVCVLMAKFLGVPKSAVSVAAGPTSRHKRLEVVGLSQEDLDLRINVLE